MYKTAVGTTKDGSVIMGIDYEVSKTPTTFEGVAQLMPVEQFAVWETRSMGLDMAKAMTKPIMSCRSADPDNVPFAFCLNTEVAKSGFIWVEYEIGFTSPSKDDISTSGKPLATAVVNLVSGPVPLPIGDPVVDITGAVDSVDTTIGTDMVTTFTLPSVEVGDQFGTYSLTAITSNYQANSVNTKVKFTDPATGKDLSSYVQKVDQVEADGIFGAIWAFVKPWLKPIALTLIETFLVADADEAQAETKYHLLTDGKDSSIVVSSPPAPVGTMEVHGLFQYDDSHYNGDGIPSKYTKTLVTGGNLNNVFELTIAPLIRLPKGLVFEIAVVATSTLHTMLVNWDGYRHTEGTLVTLLAKGTFNPTNPEWVILKLELLIDFPANTQMFIMHSTLAPLTAKDPFGFRAQVSICGDAYSAAVLSDSVLVPGARAITT